jgi:hypothetical protein
MPSNDAHSTLGGHAARAHSSHVGGAQAGVPLFPDGSLTPQWSLRVRDEVQSSSRSALRALIIR